MKSKVANLARAALLLALCVASQFLKNVSVYITGSIVNAILILAVMFCGKGYAMAIAVIAPVTSWMITGSPIISAIPFILPFIMLGNLAMVTIAGTARQSRRAVDLAVFSGIASVVKAFAMWVFIAKGILRVLGPDSGLPEKALAMASTTFSITQLITAVIGSVIAVLLFIPLETIIKE